MTHSDKNFFQKEIMMYESEFSWTIENVHREGFPKMKEIKIGLCEVKWKIGLTYKNYTNMQIGFLGENLGSHSGILTFTVKENYSGHSHTVRNSKSIQFGQYDTGMKYENISLSGRGHVGGGIQLIVFSGTITVPDCNCVQKPLEENLTELQNDILMPMKNKQFTDIDIKVGETCFPVHKFILRARSPVFARMLEHDMKESQENCITVLDTNAEIMENFITFLYSGSLEDVSFDIVIGLYSLSDKYQVTSLQMICRRFLISNISDITATEILKVSDLHSDEELKQKAIEFISCQFYKIEVSSEWSSLVESNTRLASHVLRYVSEKS